MIQGINLMLENLQIIGGGGGVEGVKLVIWIYQFFNSTGKPKFGASFEKL